MEEKERGTDRSLAACRQKRIRESVSRSHFSRENSRRLPPPGGSFTPGNAKLIERERERSPPSIRRAAKGARGTRQKERENATTCVNAAGVLRRAVNDRVLRRDRRRSAS